MIQSNLNHVIWIMSYEWFIRIISNMTEHDSNMIQINHVKDDWSMLHANSGLMIRDMTHSCVKCIIDSFICIWPYKCNAFMSNHTGHDSFIWEMPCLRYWCSAWACVYVRVHCVRVCVCFVCVCVLCVCVCVCAPEASLIHSRVTLIWLFHTWHDWLDLTWLMDMWRDQFSCDVTSSHTTVPHTATHCNTLQHTTTHCNTLQHTATHCNTLQHTATHCTTQQHSKIPIHTREHGTSRVYVTWYIHIWRDSFMWVCDMVHSRATMSHL